MNSTTTTPKRMLKLRLLLAMMKQVDATTLVGLLKKTGIVAERV